MTSDIGELHQSNQKERNKDIPPQSVSKFVEGIYGSKGLIPKNVAARLEKLTSPDTIHISDAELENKLQAAGLARLTISLTPGAYDAGDDRIYLRENAAKVVATHETLHFVSTHRENPEIPARSGLLASGLDPEVERLLNEAATVISTYAVDQNIALGKLINFGRLASLPHEEQLAGDYMAAVKVTLEAFLANGNLSLSPLFIKSYLEADLAMFINGGAKNLLEGLIKDLKQNRDKAKEGGVVVVSKSLEEMAQSSRYSPDDKKKIEWFQEVLLGKHGNEAQLIFDYPEYFPGIIDVPPIPPGIKIRPIVRINLGATKLYLENQDFKERFFRPHQRETYVFWQALKLWHGCHDQFLEDQDFFKNEDVKHIIGSYNSVEMTEIEMMARKLLDVETAPEDMKQIISEASLTRFNSAR